MRSVVRYIDSKRGAECADLPVPKLVPEHILIKVMASAISPGDEIFIRGGFGPISKEPMCCGAEGSGSVLEIGAGVPKEFSNRKVVFHKFMSTPEQVGAWSKYALIHYQNCFIVDDGIKYEEIAGAIINPLTALAIVEELKKKGHKSLIHTAAASSLGRILLPLCLKENIGIICVVRKKLYVDQLKALGAKYVLDSTATEFDKELAELATKLDVHACFDAVAGDLTGRIVKAMPGKSTIYLYGRMAGTLQSIDPGDITVKEISIVPFKATYASFFESYEKMKAAMKTVADDLKAGGKTFRTAVAKGFKLTECKDALAKFHEFSEKGKCVFLPNAFP